MTRLFLFSFSIQTLNGFLKLTIIELIIIIESDNSTIQGE